MYVMQLLCCRFQRFKDSSMVPLNEHVIYLRFDPPLQCSGKHLNYSLLIANISDPAENPMNSTLISFNCSLTSIVSRAIKVNQIGYLPKRSKVAYVGDYYADIDGGVWAVVSYSIDIVATEFSILFFPNVVFSMRTKGANCSIWTWTRVSNRFDKVDLHHLLDIQDGSLLSFRAVVANSPGDVWVVGDRGTIIHFNGYTWLKVSTLCSCGFTFSIISETNIVFVIVSANQGSMPVCCESTRNRFQFQSDLWYRCGGKWNSSPVCSEQGELTRTVACNGQASSSEPCYSTNRVDREGVCLDWWRQWVDTEV